MAELTNTKIKSISGKGGGTRKYVITEKGESLCELYIQSDGVVYAPAVEGGVQWETERKGSPGKLTFTVLQDGKLKFGYGSVVIFKFNQKNIFYGYLFTVNPQKDGRIKMTAYDQLRYFKNKHTYVYSKKRLDQLLSMICTDFKLMKGSFVNTKYSMSRVEDNQSLFDIVQNAVDETVMHTGKLYIMYDDFGKLTLKSMADMKVKTLVDDETAQDYDYTATIDEDTYNKIQVYYDNEGTREYYVANDTYRQNVQGILQLTQKASSKSLAKMQAETLLKLHQKTKRTLTVKDCFGSPTVRAGNYIPVMLKLEDMKISNYLLAEKVVHKFSESEHTFDITLIGNQFTE